MTTDERKRRTARLTTLVRRRAEGAGETDRDDRFVSRRTVLRGLGLLGAGSIATGVASADPQGQLGSETAPVRRIYVQELSGGLTGEVPITSVVGPGLAVEDETLRAILAEAISLGRGTAVYAGRADGTLQFRSLTGGSNVSVSSDDETVRISASDSAGQIAVSDDGTTVVSAADDVDFGASLSVIDGGDGTATADVSLSVADVAQNGATDGQVLTWDGSAWVTAFPGTTGDVPFDLLAGGTRALRLEPAGSSDDVNVVGGHPNNRAETTAATIGGGGLDVNDVPNVVYDSGGTVGGGRGNQAGSADGDDSTGREATVAGGLRNEASGGKSTVAGGYLNVASGDFSAIGGGEQHTAGGGKSFVGGGQGNTNSGYVGVIGGGISNTVSADRSTIGGGQDNVASGQYATVGGGHSNDASADFATIAGGGPTDTNDVSLTKNVVFDDYGAVGGGGNNQAGSGDGTSNAVYATVGGGYHNTASGQDSHVGGGSSNTASGYRSTVNAGHNNLAQAHAATIAGGSGSVAYDEYATVAGGRNNEAGSEDGDPSTARYATVGGGQSNDAFGTESTVGGGSGNAATGDRATIPGGYQNAATAAYSFAAGRVASADHAGAFVVGDSTSTTISSTQSDEFRSQMPMYAPSFNTTSARAKKTAIEPVSPSGVLDAVRELDVCGWEFREGDGSRHVGPMAGDFHDAFGLGDGESIPTVDADGVALAAIQGLADRLDELTDAAGVDAGRIDELEAELATKDERIDELDRRCRTREGRVDELESELEEREDRIDRLEERLGALERAVDGEQRDE